MKTIRIFLSSPGDVAAERALARGVIADLQKRYTGSLLVHPVFWEDLPLGSDVSFQEGIDVILSAEHGIDIAVFILWSRLGSPLGTRIRKADGTDYLSGTEREWDLMLRAREASGGTRPDILTYIRDDQNSFIEAQRGKDQPQLLEMVLQQGKVKDFIAEHFTDRETGTNTRAYFTFHEPITFAHRLRTHLRAWLDERLVDSDLAAMVWHPAEQGSPFRGLEAFEYEHAPLFFGREPEICDLQIRLRQQAKAGCAFVLLVGASGSGKSSLARAGVAPAVAEHDREDEAAEWRRAVFTPGGNRDDLLLGLVRALAAPDALPELSNENPAELADGLARDPELTFRFKLRPLLTGRRRLLLIFDQMEELFTHGEITAEAQCQLGAALGALARSGEVWVLATVRSDYYAKFQKVPELLALKGEGAQVDLLPPVLGELQCIITQPARATGLRFEENANGERLDARLLEDAAAHPEALPLLEFCLDVLYERQVSRGDGVLRWADYEAMRTAAAAGQEADAAATSSTPGQEAESGLAGALVSQAEAALASLPAKHQRQCLSAIFSKLLDLSSALERETPVRRTALEAELLRNPYQGGEGNGQDDAELPGARAFLQAFTARRLLVTGVASDAADGGWQEPHRTYTVAHEALLRNWWRLRRLQAEQAEFFRIRHQVEHSQADWLAAGQDDSFLLAEGLPLQLAHKLATEAPELLIAGVADYIAHSSKRLERLRHRRRRLTTGVIAGLTLLAMGAVIGAWFGFSGKHEAQRQTAIAREQTSIAQDKTKEAERQSSIAQQKSAETKAQVHQALFSDLATARDHQEKGNWRQGLMYLRRAQRYDDPDNRLATAWLWNEVVYGRMDRGSLPQFLLRHEYRVLSAAYSPDGTRIVTACGEIKKSSYAQQWDAATGKPVGVRMCHEDAVSSATYSPDGRRIVTASEDGTARQWDAATGAPIGEPLRHKDAIRWVAYSPDGRRIVTASEDDTAQQWETATGKPIGKPLQHEGVVHCVAYSPDGKHIVTATEGNSGYAQQWDAVTGQVIGGRLIFNRGVLSAAYSPDGKHIVAAGEDRAFQQWDANTGLLIGKSVSLPDLVFSVAYSPDGLFIVTACANGDATQWDARTGRAKGRPMHHDGAALCAAYSPDGQHIISACVDGTAQVWGTASSETSGEPIHIGGEGNLSSAAYSPDGTRIVTASNHDIVEQWDAFTGKTIGAPIHPDEVKTAAYSSDGAHIITAGNRAVQQWDVATGKQYGEPIFIEDGVDSAAYSPDGKRIVTASNAYNAYMAQQWDATRGKPIGPPMRHDDLIHCAAYSPDGTRIVTAGGYREHGYAQRWESSTSQPIGEPLRHEKEVNFAAYSPDGRRIVTASDDKTARQWDAATGRPIGEPYRHEEGVFGAVYSSDRTRIVTAVDNQTARQWDVATGQPIGGPFWHDDWVLTATYSPDGSRILTTCRDGTVRQWDCLYPSTPAPPWMDALIQVVAEGRFNANEELEGMSNVGCFALRIDLERRLGNNPSKPHSWEQLGIWALTSPSERAYTPNSTHSTVEVATRELTSGRQSGVEAALRMVPNLPLAHLALAGFEGYADRADFLRRYELARLPPTDVPLRMRAAAMLRDQKQARLSLQALEKISTAAPPTSDLLASLALTRWQVGDKDGGVRDCRRLLALDPGFVGPAKAWARALSEHDATALTDALAETLRRHPELARKPSPAPGP